MFYKVHTGEPHDLANLGLVCPVVALAITLVAHGFGVMWTLEPHGQTIG